MNNKNTISKTKSFVFKNNTDVQEYHLIIEIKNKHLTYQEQLQNLFETFKETLAETYPNAIPVFARFFLSDAYNQIKTLKEKTDRYIPCAISYIQQSPANGTKIALWVYLISKVKVTMLAPNICKIHHGEYKHFFAVNMHGLGNNSEIQTKSILQDYIHKINKEKCTLKDDCIRTWFYINDIDNNYAGMVKGRNKIFDQENLTDNTHFISSTGIGGQSANPHELIQMDAYSIKGLKKNQVKFLYALHYLNRTSEYHVRFERGTIIDYGDRRHVFISGTASINNKGKVVYPEDIKKQTQRMWENTEALLLEADMSFKNIGEIVVYLRDIADYEIVNYLFRKRFPNIPYLILKAPVYRPEWLIEMECMGVKAQTNSNFNKF